MYFGATGSTSKSFKANQSHDNREYINSRQCGAASPNVPLYLAIALISSFE